jgi:hypothetical protein
MAWGISYFRFDFYKRVSLSHSVFEKNNFKKFLSYYINELNTSYTYVDTINYKDIDSEIEMNYEKLRSKLNMPYPCGQRKIKTMIFQRVTTSIGISGYFGPFFNEVHVNFYPLPFEQASIIAHEKAHQFGISSEAECNLYAYIICNASNIKYIKYSGNYGILSYVLSNMRKLLPDEYHNWFKQIRPEIIADYKKSYEHWQKAINSKMTEFQSVAYDAYLKLNKIESGIENYSEMAALLVSWYNAGNLK